MLGMLVDLVRAHSKKWCVLLINICLFMVEALV